MTSPSQSQGLGEVIRNEAFNFFISCIFLCTGFLQNQAKEAYAVSADQAKSSGGGFGVGERRLVIRGPDVLISAGQFRLTSAQQVQMRPWHLVLEPTARQRPTHGRKQLSATFIYTFFFPSRKFSIFHFPMPYS